MPLRPAWVEIDLKQLDRNFQIIVRDKPANLDFMCVLKDDAYGHGMLQVARTSLQFGAKYLAAVTVDEALSLRADGITVPILVMGERTPDELAQCVEHNLTCLVNTARTVNALQKIAAGLEKKIPVQVEVDTGLSRYGVRWTDAPTHIAAVANAQGLTLEGVMSHFAMSDELDKSFAMQQLGRFVTVLDAMSGEGVHVNYRHMCNTGGFLDLPAAHFDMVRMGILPLGVYPSQVCRRIPGLSPIMSVKTRIVAIQEIEAGDYVGYGMRYQATTPSRIAVLPVGYGDGYPRVRNQGFVLVCGRRAPIVGGNAMDAMMVDISDILQAQVMDEVVLQGKQKDEEIDVHEVASLKKSVSYDILAGWRSRLPRVYVNNQDTPVND